MKIAVLLFGHLRTFEQCWQGLRDNLLSRYDCDVFMHTWDETDHNTLTWHNRRTKPLAVTEDMLRLVRERYGPKALLVEHQQPIEEESFTFLIEPYTTVSTASWHYMFESLDKANRLRREYEARESARYDLVLATRPDIVLYHPLDIEATLYQAELCGYDLDRVRFIGSLPGSTKQNPARLIVNKGNDLLFFGRPAVIDRYIEANLGIDSAFFREHLLNVVSVYTAAEIRAGLDPVPISYQFAYDWRNIRPKPAPEKKADTSEKSKPKPKAAVEPKPEELPVPPRPLWKRAARKLLWVLYGPVRGAVTFARKHEWLLEK